jgi:phenylpropionate dioxygenase-like ring-hydroxylating dioxygenase large terminal subunit
MTMDGISAHAPTSERAPVALFHQNWFPLALAHEVTAAAPLGVDFLGTRVIVYRGADDKPMVQGAYCPHLGADLSLGQLIDGRIRCPFHHWSYGADGRCAHIPTGDKIPPGAVLPLYPCVEAWGLVWAFNGAAPLFAPPRIPDAEEASLAFAAYCYGLRPIDPWVAVSNGVDFQHLRALHGLRTEMPDKIEAGAHGIEFNIETPFYRQHGLITGTNCFAQHLRSGDTEMWMLFSGRSDGPGRSMSYYVVGATPGPGSAQRLAAVKEMAQRLINEDAPILNTIRFRKGTLVPSDRFLARFLKYVADFPVAAAQD